MVLPRFQARGGGGRGGRGRPSIKDRIGVAPVAAGIATGGPRPRNSLSVHSRLGIRGGGAVRGRTVGARIQTSPVITDARQKINLNRVKTGRISDAREKIETKRVNQSLISPLQGFAVNSRNNSTSFPLIKSLKITTSNSPPRQGVGLFRNAVSDMGSPPWGYSPAPPSPFQNSPSAMLTRTISNPQARGYPPPPLPPTFSSYGRSAGGSFYSESGSSAGRLSMSSRRDTGGRFRTDSWDDDSMDVDSTPPPGVRSSLQARLDVPKFKIKVSNLQSSVSTDDLMELFADVGDLITVKSVRSGEADVYYKSKSDCIKAIDAYHNRLLDGSPMKVVLHDERDRPAAREPERRMASSSSGILSSLRSSGAPRDEKIPKSSSHIKIHPDLSAIHKVLFQPTSSANAAKQLFKGGH